MKWESLEMVNTVSPEKGKDETRVLYPYTKTKFRQGHIIPSMHDVWPQAHHTISMLHLTHQLMSTRLCVYYCRPRRPYWKQISSSAAP